MNRATRILLLPLLLAPGLWSQDTYRIDPVHSSITFRVRYLVGKVSGSFGTFNGTILLDDAKPAKSSVDARIEVMSISTQNEGRDKHLRTADFFDVPAFPAMTFKSTHVKEVSKGKLDVTGDLTMRGVTKPVVLSVSILGSMPNPKTQATMAGFSATTKLNRKDYGLSGGTPMVGEDVDIELEILAEKIEPKK